METLMAPAGEASEKIMAETLAQHPGQYIAVVEGSIPTRDGGVYCTVGGRSALAIAQEVCRNSLTTIAVGTCAFAGGWPGAAPNPTGAMGVKDAVTGIPRLINMPGCPVNIANLTALVVYYLTYNTWPSTDSLGRPQFAYGETIHDECPRHDHYEEGRFALAWGDAGHRAGYCLYRLGCRGPRTRANCNRVKWNGGTNWPVGAGHPCVGCAQPGFWDSMTRSTCRCPVERLSRSLDQRGEIMPDVFLPFVANPDHPGNCRRSTHRGHLPGSAGRPCCDRRLELRTSFGE
jgi:hydrogenase small subunit